MNRVRRRKAIRCCRRTGASRPLLLDLNMADVIANQFRSSGRAGRTVHGQLILMGIAPFMARNALIVGTSGGIGTCNTAFLYQLFARFVYTYNSIGDLAKKCLQFLRDCDILFKLQRAVLCRARRNAQKSGQERLLNRRKYPWISSRN